MDGWGSSSISEMSFAISDDPSDLKNGVGTIAAEPEPSPASPHMLSAEQTGMLFAANVVDARREITAAADPSVRAAPAICGALRDVAGAVRGHVLFGDLRRDGVVGAVFQGHHEGVAPGSRSIASAAEWNGW